MRQSGMTLSSVDLRNPTVKIEVLICGAIYLLALVLKEKVVKTLDLYVPKSG